VSESIKDYRIIIEWSEPDGEFFAAFADFRTFSASGATPQEALGELLFAFEGYEEAAQEQGFSLPAPTSRRSPVEVG
jgi:predicted RNase H-like HicB family nuclease